MFNDDNNRTPFLDDDWRNTGLQVESGAFPNAGLGMGDPPDRAETFGFESRRRLLSGTPRSFSELLSTEDKSTPIARRSMVSEMNRQFIEERVPKGNEAQAFTIYSLFEVTGLMKCLPAALRPAEDQLPSWAAVSGAVLPVVVGAWISNIKIDPDNPLIARTFGGLAVIGGWWLAAPWPMIATSLSPVWLYPLVSADSASTLANCYFNYIIMLLIGATVSFCFKSSILNIQY